MCVSLANSRPNSHMFSLDKDYASFLKLSFYQYSHK